MYWYVLFVQTGREYKVEQILKQRLDSEVCTPFVPLQEILFRIAGTVRKEIKPLFPGYVFIESKLNSQEFTKRINNLIYSFSSIVNLLKYSDTEIAMRDSERQILMSLCNKDYCIESSIGIKVGNKIKITNGPLKGLESIVRNINRHKRQAQIGIELMGDVRLVNVALEIIEKI